jgi:UDP-MurNAc hydroxylase
MQYPSNHHLAENARAALLRENSLLVLSHEHGDHFDREFLSRLPSGLEVGIARFGDDFLSSELERLGFRVTEVDEGSRLPCGDLSVRFFVVDEGTASDSAILVEGEGFRFLNQNDCKMFDRLSEVPLPITHYAVQYSGASWYPECFLYDGAAKKKRSAESVANKIRNVRHALHVLRPEAFVPSAGPVVFPFLPPDFGRPASSVFVHQDKLEAELELPAGTSICFARPGDLVERGVGTSPIPAPSDAEIAWYQGNCVDAWELLPDEFDLTALLEVIDARLSGIAGIAPSDTPVIEFSWGAGEVDRCLVDLHEGSVALGRGPLENQPSISVSAEPRYFRLLVENPRWQEVVLSFRARIQRSPDRFNNWVNLFLYSDPETVEANFRSAIVERTERVEVEVRDVGRFTVDRWCPHQGADLATAQVEGSCVVCPRHGWRFDIADAGRDSRSGTSINATRSEGSGSDG